MERSWFRPHWSPKALLLSKLFSLADVPLLPFLYRAGGPCLSELSARPALSQMCPQALELAMFPLCLSLVCLQDQASVSALVTL